jgi:tetratricopeptide (TPR) repeat protein
MFNELPALPGGVMNAADAPRVVKVFVSSPIDVAPERGRAQAVAAKLNREYEGRVRFEPVLWEEQFYKADRSFQPQISEAVACDIVVSIFWTRIGSELPADFPRMPSGERYPSGTTYELLTALAASTAKGIPDVYVFRKTADATLPTADAVRRRQAQTQLDALEAFWSEWFKSETGEFKAAFQTFATTDAFERQLEQLLRQWLESNGLLGPRLTWPKEKGAPFPGLAPFEAEHAAVFFGRGRAIDEARRRVVAAAERGTPFLLIVGASGAGKSSLARAGLIPRLTTPGVATSVDVWRVACMKPSEGQAGPLLSLAAALFAALPELAQSDFPTPIALADHFRGGAAAAARPVVRALERVAEIARRERHADQPLRPALVLLVDQLEEVFAQGVDDDERAAFAKSLKELVATRQVWCVATLRADLYELLLKQPTLAAMKEAGASLDLAPPGAAELAEIVRAPAAAAGLVFESDDKHGALDERLLADARTADSLPLLQFTLRQLYERRREESGETRLTHGAYEELGGLQGAIAEEAERAIAGLPAETLDALPRLLRRLAEPARDGKTLTLREVPQGDVAADKAEAALVEALLGARIMIARTDAAGHPTLRLAHDAVLASWPKAASAAQASREFYRVRGEVEDALRRWQEHGQTKDRLIPRGVPLAEAEQLAADFGRELPADLTAYISASRNRARAFQRLVAASAVVFFALTVVATAAGIWAYRAQQQAAASLKIAQDVADSLVIDIASGLRDRGLPAATVRKVLETAKAAHEQLAKPNDPALQFRRSMMLEEFGKTYQTLGDLTQALKAYRDSLAIKQRLAKADPSYTGYQRDLSGSYNHVGDVLRTQGNLPEALKAYRESLAITERLTQADPTNTEWQRDLLVSYNKVGSVLQDQGNLPDALKAYRDSLAITERLAKAEPSNADRQSDLSFSYQRIGEVLGDQGNLPDALKAYRDSLAISDRLAKGDPSNANWQDNLAVSYNAVGLVLQRQGNLPDALKAFRDSLAITERLAKSDPSNTGWQEHLAASYSNVGLVLQAQGNLPDARKAYRDSLAITERLAKADPSNADWQGDLSVAYANVGDVLRAQGNLPDALKAYRDSLAIRERLATSDPSNAGWQRYLADSYNGVGVVLQAQGNLPEALKAYRDSLAIIRERLAKADPSNADWQHDLSVAYANVGDVLQAQGNLPEALKADRDSLAIRERLVKVDPGNTGWQSDLSFSYQRIGEALKDQGNLPDALKAYRDSLAIRERLAKSDPGNSAWQVELVRNYARLASVHQKLDDIAEALIALRKGREILATLVAIAPSNAQWKNYLAWFDGQIARLEGRATEAGKN